MSKNDELAALAQNLADPLWAWLIGRVPYQLSYAQRVLNPAPVAAAILGDFIQPWPIQILAFYVAVFVNAPNSGVNFWTFSIRESGATTLAALNTSLIGSGTWTRISQTTISAQPTGGNGDIDFLATPTGAPGTVYVVPAVLVLRTG